MRERAENELKNAQEKGHISGSISELVHELQVHQAELEMQNEELRKSHEDLSDLYNQYHDLYDSAPVGYFSIDEDGIIRNVNIKGAELLDLTKNKIIRRGFSRFIPPNERNKYYHVLMEIASSGEINDIELKLKRNDTLFYADMKIKPIYHKDDEKYRIIITDITESKKKEEQLKEALDDLKRSNEELQQFAYVASHDLQEPLRTIASFTQLLERRYKDKLDSDADEFIDYIVEAAKRMKQQIQDLLEYSRVGTKGKEFKPVNMNEILNQTIENLNTSIEESKAEITIDKLPNVKGDAKQLERIFQNLISNAIKFRKHEKPLKIHISAYKSEDDKEYIFSIQDNGIGIEEQYNERIFVIFQQLHTMDAYKGTGIGLSIVKRIIEHHDGRVWVESEFGKGSTFYFTLPVKK